MFQAKIRLLNHPIIQNLSTKRLIQSLIILNLPKISRTPLFILIVTSFWSQRWSIHRSHRDSQRQSCNTIKQLKCGNDDILTNNDDTLKNMCDFYQTLYNSTNVQDAHIIDYLRNVHIEHILSDEEKNLLDSPLTIDECRTALFDMKCNKSPGFDGLPSEFYKAFWDKMKLYLFSSISQSLEEKFLSFTQRLAILSLIHKKGDKNSLNNYRPLSLTHTDYKIIAFAKRLQKVIDKFISHDQSAYIKGRFIGINARTIVDIYEYCVENDIDGILLFLDLQKSFWFCWMEFYVSCIKDV